MSDIKAVIQLLCQHLNILLKVNLKPDNFRLAKFNKNDKETVQELWTTLEKLCLALGPHINQNQAVSPQIWVKLDIASRGYSCAEFYKLPSTADAIYGSRELLLALMWLIAKENALRRLTQECVKRSPLCQEYSDAPQKLENGSVGGLKTLKIGSKKHLSLEDQINYALWLASRIKHNLNQIQDLEEERIKHTHLVHEATAGSSGLPHLSVFETKLIRDPELLNEWMPRLSQLNDLLNIHSKWLKKKSAFWEWMDTIIELKAKEIEENDSIQPSSEKELVDFMKAVHLHLEDSKTSKVDADPAVAVPVSSPRFFISSLYAKSTSNLIRKASSSDLLADMGLNENSVVMHASDWLAHVDSALQEVEKLKHDKQQELNLMLQAMTQKLGLVAITDVPRGEVESEDCSK